MNGPHLNRSLNEENDETQSICSSASAMQNTSTDKHPAHPFSASVGFRKPKSLEFLGSQEEINSQDIEEILFDKFDTFSENYRSAFKRILQSIGKANGSKMKIEDFKEAIVRDFHLFEKKSGEGANDRIQAYQKRQKDMLNDLIDQASIENKDGFIRFNDFVRLVSKLNDNKSIHCSTKNISHSRFASTMGKNVKEVLEKKQQQLIDNKTIKPPPYGGWATSWQIQEFFEKKYKDKLSRLNHLFDVNGFTPATVSVASFLSCLQKYDRYITDRDVKQMLIKMGYRQQTDMIELKKFFTMYTSEIIKPKSHRGSTEETKLVQWPCSCTPDLLETKPKVLEMKTKRTLKMPIRYNRSCILRNDKIGGDFQLGNAAASFIKNPKYKLKNDATDIPISVHSSPFGDCLSVRSATMGRK